MPSPKLTRPPNTLEVLERIEAKLDRLDRTLGPLAMLGEVPAVASTAADAFDDAVRGHEADLDARLRSAVGLLERLCRPRTLATLHQAVDLLEALPGLLATGADAVDDIAGPMGLHGRVEAMASLLARVTEPEVLGLLQRLLDQLARAHDGVEQLADESLPLAGLLADVLQHARTQGDRRLGLLGLLKALRDPHAQRALGFAVGALEGLGRSLDDETTPKALPG